MNSKIKKFEELPQIAQQLKFKGKTVVQCHGTFDLMHPGHIKHFEAAKKQGNILIVTVTADNRIKKGIGRPVFKEQLRVESIAALSCVDYVVIDPHNTALESINVIQPDVFVKGGDYWGKENEMGHPTWQEKQNLDRYGGRLHFTKEPVTFSSTALMNEHLLPYPEQTRKFLHGMRSKCTENEFLNIFERIRKLKVLIVGDAILDVYHYCTVLGRSMKEEIQRVKIRDSEMFFGGGLAVANTIAGFCEKVGIAAVLGRKDVHKEAQHESFIRKGLLPNITPHFFYRHDAPTVINERFVDHEVRLVSDKTKMYLKKYFGVYQINEDPIDRILEKEIIDSLQSIMSSYDIIVVTDYGLGMLSNPIIDVLCEKAPYLAVNTQTNSVNFGYNFITKYTHTDYVSISQPELRLALHDKHAPIEQLVEKIKNLVCAKTVSITLGPFGTLVYDGTSFVKIPILSTDIVDRIGAGDAYFALSSLGTYLGLPLEITGFLGGIAAALSCTIFANKETIDRPVLWRSLQTLLK